MALQSVQNRRVVRYDYVANDREELNITKDETLTVLDSSGLWWKVKNDKGTVGLIPSNYLWGLGDGPAPSPAPGIKAEEPPHVYHQPADVVMVNHSNGPSLNIVARAKYRYQGTRDDELCLEKGDELIVLEKEADGWWKGRCGTRIGWFPFNYVEEVASASVQSDDGGGKPAAASAPTKEKSFICGVIALYSFSSGNPEELAFQKGDLLDIIDQPADDPDWWEARKADGTKGLIPRNYVEIVHNAEPVFGSGSGTDGGGGGIRSQLMKPSLPPSSIISSSYPPPPFTHEVWYHGKVARKDAETVLNTRAENGQFIVRSSETKPGDYSISMKAPDRIKHFNVKNLADGRLGIGQRKFDSMDELIQHYRRAPIYTTTTEGKMYLTEGLPRGPEGLPRGLH